MFSIQLHDRIVGDDVKKTVSGRDIFEALELSEKYSDWAKRQVKSLKLIENYDFIVFHDFTKNTYGGRPSIEYYFTLDAAKHMALASRSEKGRAYRQALIDLENRVRMLPARNDDYTNDVVDQLKEIVKELGKISYRLNNGSEIESTRHPEYLSPNRLAYEIGIKSGVELNRILQRLGLQFKCNGNWIATDKADGLFLGPSKNFRGSYRYSYRWNTKEICKLIDEYYNG